MCSGTLPQTEREATAEGNNRIKGERGNRRQETRLAEAERERGEREKQILVFRDGEWLKG